MIDALRRLNERVARFDRDAQGILSAFEDSKSRIITLDQTRKQLTHLSVNQDELFVESLACIERGIYRAAHVMAWAAFMDFLEAKLGSDGLQKVHAARPAWAKHSTVEDLRENVPEFQLVEAARDVGLLRKSECKSLLGLLAKRNECAHPGAAKPNMNEALGYVSDLLNRVDQLRGRTL